MKILEIFLIIFFGLLVVAYVIARNEKTNLNEKITDIRNVVVSGKPDVGSSTITECTNLYINTPIVQEEGKHDPKVFWYAVLPQIERKSWKDFRDNHKTCKNYSDLRITIGNKTVKMSFQEFEDRILQTK